MQCIKSPEQGTNEINCKDIYTIDAVLQLAILLPCIQYTKSNANDKNTELRDSTHLMKEFIHMFNTEHITNAVISPVHIIRFVYCANLYSPASVGHLLD